MGDNMNQKYKGPPFYGVIYNGNIGWNTQELYRRKQWLENKHLDLNKVCLNAK